MKLWTYRYFYRFDPKTKTWIEKDLPCKDQNPINQKCAKGSTGLGRYIVDYECEYADNYLFSYNNWKSVYTSDIKVYEDGCLITTVSDVKAGEVILGGDGLNRDSTFMVIVKDGTKIVNMRGELIKKVYLGPDAYVELKSVNRDYFLYSSEEICTYTKFLGLIDKRKLFSDTENSINTPYTDARVGISICDFAEENCYIPIETDETGIFFVNTSNINDKKHVPYESVSEFDVDINYDQKESGILRDAFKMFGFNDTTDDQIEKVIEDISRALASSDKVSLDKDYLNTKFNYQ